MTGSRLARSASFSLLSGRPLGSSPVALSNEMIYALSMRRFAHRKHLKSDLRQISDGLSVDHFDPKAFISLMRVMRERLAVSSNIGSVSPLMEFTYDSFEKSSSRLSGDNLACRRGCSHCCNIWTDAYAPEVLFTAKQVRDSREMVVSAIAPVGEFSGKVPIEERGALPISCPLLVDHVCAFYNVRPLNCRTAVSLDETACVQAFLENEEVDIPVPPGWNILGQSYSLAMKGAVFHAGLAYEPYEWNSAVALAVRDSNLETRWLEGEEVFSGLRANKSVPPFTHPFWKSLYNQAFGE